MKTLNKRIGNFFMEKIEKKSVKVAEMSPNKACNNFIYEPKNPLVKLQEKN